MATDAALRDFVIAHGESVCLDMQNGAIQCEADAFYYLDDAWSAVPECNLYAFPIPSNQALNIWHHRDAGAPLSVYHRTPIDEFFGPGMSINGNNVIRVNAKRISLTAVVNFCTQANRPVPR